MWWTILIILIVAVVFYFGYVSFKQTRKLQESGKIIVRPSGFHEQKEIFSVHNADLSKIIEGIKSSDLGGASATKVEGKQHIVFEHSLGWKAQLYKTKDPEDGPAEPDLSTWVFNFTHWKTQRYSVTGQLEMNILLTSIEKMFLSIDPAAKVTSAKMAVKSKTSFF